MFWFEKVSPHQALESGRNPIVGDPDRIAKLAADLMDTAECLRTQNQRLRAVRSETFWKGEAAHAFDAFKEKLPPLLDNVIERYSRVAKALARYHLQIREAQHLAARALRNYEAAKGARQIAWTSAQNAQMLQTRTPSLHREPVCHGPDPDRQMAQAHDQMQAAVREMTLAMEQRDRAAHTCAGLIRHAINDDLANEIPGRRAHSSHGTPATASRPRC